MGSRQLVAVALLAIYGVGLAEKNITSDTYFYGQSEPVYPSRMPYLAHCCSGWIPNTS